MIRLPLIPPPCIFIFSISGSRTRLSTHLRFLVREPGVICSVLFSPPTPTPGQEAVVSARFSALSPGTQLGGVWYKPVEQFILPKVLRFVP